MRKVLVIASRDYHAAVRTKAFVISLVLMPVMMLGGVIVQALLKDVQDVTDKQVAIIDRSAKEELYAAMVTAAEQRNQTQAIDPKTGRKIKPRFIMEKVDPAVGTEPAQLQRFELSERVRKGELLAFVEISPDPYSPPPSPAYPTVSYHSNLTTYIDFQRWMEGVIDEAVQAHRFKQEGYPIEKVRSLLQPVQVVAKGLSKRNPGTGAIKEGETEDRIAAVLAPVGLILMMFLTVIVGSSPLIQGVVEEKTLRIAEVLLGSVTPFQLMLGKLLGTVGVSLTLASVYLAGAYWAATQYGVADRLPGSLIAFFLLFEVLAVLMYGSIFIAVGAACSDLRETQSLLMPVLIIIMLPLFFLGHVLRFPGSNVSVGLSFLPTATPMLMILRQGFPPGVPPWQNLAAIAVVIATTLLCVWAAGRIFRVGILMQGKGARLGELVRWVVKG